METTIQGTNVEFWRYHIAILSVLISLLILWKLYQVVTRKLIPGSYLRRGAKASGLLVGFYMLSNAVEAEGYPFHILIGLEILMCAVLWFLRKFPGMMFFYTVVFWWGFLYLSLTGVFVCFLDYGTEYFNTSLNHLHIGTLWIPFFIVFIIDHLEKYEALIADTTRKAGFWSGVFFLLSWLAGLNHGMVATDLRVATMPFHWVSVVIAFIFLAIHLKRSWENSRKRGWGSISREFWPSLTMLLPVAALAVICVFFPFFYQYSHEYTQGEFGWTKEEAQANLSNPITGLAVCTLSGSGIPLSNLTSEQTGGSCGQLGCHSDIEEQQQHSSHRFSANAAYRKVAGLLKEQLGTEATRFCATCHDPVPLLSGSIQKDTPYPFPDSPGVNCIVCHSLRPKPLQLENGVYEVIPQPQFFQSYYNLLLMAGGYMLIRKNVQEHGRQWKQTNLRDPSLCASCHTLTVNGHVHRANYKEWLESPFGPKGKEPKTCIGCHMPSAGISAPMQKPYHDHEFAAANVGLAGLSGADIGKRVKFIAESLKLDIAVKRMEGGALDVGLVMTNTGSGHNFPAAPKDLIEYWLEYSWDAGSQEVHWVPFPGTGSLFKEDYFDKDHQPVVNHELWKVLHIEGGNSIPSGQARSFHGTLPLPQRTVSNLWVRLMHRRFREDFVNEEMKVSKIHLAPVEILRVRKEL